MSEVCSNCQFSIQDFPDLFCTVRKLSTKDGLFVNCHHYLPKTVFDRLTASPGVLAPKFIYEATTCDSDGHILSGYRSTITAGFWLAKAEAIAVTVAKLNEVCNE